MPVAALPVAVVISLRRPSSTPELLLAFVQVVAAATASGIGSTSAAKGETANAAVAKDPSEYTHTGRIASRVEMLY